MRDREQPRETDKNPSVSDQETGAYPNVLLVTLEDWGGMVHYASQLANALVERTRVTQIVGKGIDRSLFADEVDVVEVTVPNEWGKLRPSLLRDLYTLRGEIQRADVVHITGHHPMVLALVGSLRRSRMFLTLHDVQPHDYLDDVLSRVTTRALVACADRVVVHGDHNRSEFRDRYGANTPVLKIRHGDYSFFREYSDGDIEYDRELLFFGLIRRYKGVDTLLEAERLLSERADDYRVTIAGDGELTDRSRQLLRDSESVRFLNEYVSNERVAELFGRCRAVVLPYREATQSGIVPIAYSFEKPVVATSVGGLPEVIEDGRTGYLVEPEDPQALADRCYALLQDENRAIRMGQNGDGFRREHMDWGTIATELLTAYGEDVRT